MLSVNNHPKLLRLWSLAYRARRAVHRRAPASRVAASSRDHFYQLAWSDAAASVGATIEALGDEVYEITLGGLRTRVSRNYTELDDPVTLQVAGNKPLVYRLLAGADLPVPQHAEFSLADLAPAMALLSSASGPCVVKPAKDTGGGQGVTTSLTHPRQLPQAVALAAAFCDELLIEQQLGGANYRLLYLDGKLLDAIERRPPTLTGDGKHTIRQLVVEANRRRNAAGHKVSQVQLSVDLDMKRTLALQNLSLSSALPDGKSIIVKTVINENGALDNVSAMDRVCDAVVSAGARAAQVVGARLAGVDVITTDPGRPLDECGGVILEVNTTPGYYYHQLGQGGCPVARQVLQAIFDLPRVAGSQRDESFATAAR